jgi:hypothetical protein
VLTLTDATWRQLLDLLATSPPGVERVAYLDGIHTGGGDAIVTTVTVPHAQQSAGHFTVTAEEMSRAGAHLRAHQLVRLAQVHTHPGSDTRHSVTDDERAYSRKPGAVSIVLPWHAAGAPAPADGAVHVHDGHAWHRLGQQDAQALIRLVPATIDTRHEALPLASPQSGNGLRRARWRDRWTTFWVHVTRRR